MPFPFTTFSQDTLNHIVPGQRTMQDALNAADAEDISAAGALSTTIYESRLSVTGTMAFTLADGPAGIAGMRKRIVCVAAASVPVGTLTIASPESTAGLVCATTFQFDTVGQAIELLWTGTKWRCTRVQRAGGVANGVVVGTTVLTGINLWANYCLSVTGTVTSSTASGKGIPNGSAVGEVIFVTSTTAGSLPSGTIELSRILMSTGVTANGTLGTVNNTGLWMSLMWNGTAWFPLGNLTLVLT